MLNKLIPFNRPSLGGGELHNIAQAIEQGHISGVGKFTEAVEKKLSESINPDGQVLLTTSCTHALEMAAILADISAGDEVIVPSFTFVSSASAFLMQGAVPVFCDIRTDTLNIDEKQLEQLITSKTKVIVVVHYAGVSCEMNPIIALCKKYNILLVEDNAHGLFASYEGRCLGSMGDLATQSFHETKNIYCGEGGALIINKPEFIQRAEIIREKGTNRSRFFRGEVDKYTWVDKGSSYVMSDMLAAFLLAQLDYVEVIQYRRKMCWLQYDSDLRNWAYDNKVQTPFVPDNCIQAYHMYYLIMPSEDLRNKFIAFLKQKNISAVFHYLPLHNSPMGMKVGVAPLGCPVTTDLSARLVRLPFFHDLRPDEQAYVTKSILEFKWP